MGDSKDLYLYAVPLAWVLGGLCAGIIFEKIILSRLRKFAAKTSWEGDEVIGEAENSVFTHYLTRGLQTGDADAAEKPAQVGARGRGRAGDTARLPAVGLAELPDIQCGLFYTQQPGRGAAPRL